jgi:Holliday junction resolvase RusA-like endonuclease
MARTPRRPPPPRPPEFEFVVTGPPASAHAARRAPQELAAWKAAVASAARLHWAANRSPRSDALSVRITEFALLKTRDLDNIGKPILDALQGIVYRNDRQILELVVDWRPIDGLFRALHMSPLVALAFTRGSDFLWIRIETHTADPDITR